MTARLVVTADDVGLHSGMTAGALAAHDHGIVTAVSVSPNGKAFDDAVARLRERPNLQVGVHLTLVGEEPLSPVEEIPSLVTANGSLLGSVRGFAWRYAGGSIREASVVNESRRQVERLLETGLPVVHLNSHQHLHMLPRVFDVVARLAEEYGIPWLRIPNDPAVSRSISARALQLRVLNRLGRRARRALPNGVASPDRTIGVLDAGRLTVAKVLQAVQDLAGVTELICHPGIGADALAASYRWGYSWDRETQALCDAELAEVCRPSGFPVLFRL